MNEPKSKPPMIEGGPDVTGMLSRPVLPIWGYNVVFAVLLIAAAYGWYSGFALDEKLAKADERLPRLVAGGSLLICAFLCRIIVWP